MHCKVQTILHAAKQVIPVLFCHAKNFIKQRWQERDLCKLLEEFLTVPRKRSVTLGVEFSLGCKKGCARRDVQEGIPISEETHRAVPSKHERCELQVACSVEVI